MKYDKAITLEEHNTTVSDMCWDKHNGIECPVCGHVLYDPNPSMQYLTFPGQVDTKCTNGECTYTGRRDVLK